MKKIKLVFFIFILTLTVLLGMGVILERKNTPIGFSFESIFSVIGKPVKTADRVITKTLNITVEEEKKFGEKLKNEIEKNIKYKSPYQDYLNLILKNITKEYNPKKLDWQIYVTQGGPNAFSIAGGIIFITEGMLDLIETEAELVAILGHEKGHIDLGHCIDQVRFSAKLGQDNFFDLLTNNFGLPFFSKTQEHEADQYGFDLLLRMKYDPEALGLLFSKLWEEKAQKNILIDFFRTHPSTKIRSENWLEKGRKKKYLNKNIKYYVGKENYENKSPRTEQKFE